MGYWAWLLKAFHNCDIKCYDKRSEFKKWHIDKTDKKTINSICYVPPIFENDLKIIAENNPDRSLFLCWPVDNADIIKYYKGKYVIYIGESDGGCTATGEFFDIIENEFKTVKTYNIQQWFGLHDYMWIYKRKEIQKYG